MEHYSKYSFLGAQLWAAIQILAPKDRGREFEYSIPDTGEKFLCQDYGSTFGIRDLSGK